MEYFCVNSYFRYTGRLFLGYALFVALTLSQLYEKRRRNKYWASEESTLKNLCEGHHFFDCPPSFLCHFLLPYSFTTFSKWHTYWMAPYCYGWYSVWCRKYENILQFNTVLTNLFLVTTVAQFTTKSTNSERAIYFLSFKSCSIN